MELQDRVEQVDRSADWDSLLSRLRDVERRVADLEAWVAELADDVADAWEQEGDRG